MNFNGGTLKANADNSNFLRGTTRVLLDAGGATVDTADHNVTINEPFVAPMRAASRPSRCRTSW